MTTIYISTLSHPRGVFTAAGETRSKALRAMRALLLEYAARNRLKRNWFPVDEITTAPVELGAGYHGAEKLTEVAA